jgi:hypothetical protein
VAVAYQIQLRSLPHSGSEMSKHDASITTSSKVIVLDRIDYTVSPAVATFASPALEA